MTAPCQRLRRAHPPHALTSLHPADPWTPGWVGHSPTVSCRGPRTGPVAGLAAGHLHHQSLQWGTAVWGGRRRASPESSSVSQHTARLPACVGPAGGEHRQTAAACRHPLHLLLGYSTEVGTAPPGSACALSSPTPTQAEGPAQVWSGKGCRWTPDHQGQEAGGREGRHEGGSRGQKREDG